MEKGQKSIVWLKALVIGMGVLILVLFITIVGTIALRLSGYGGESEDGFGKTALPVPPGCDIAEAVPDGDGRLILRLTGGEACRQVLLVRLSDGTLLGTLEAGETNQ